MHFVRFEGPFNEVVAAAEYDVRDLTDLTQAATTYGQRWRVAVRLDRIPDQRLPVVLEILGELVEKDGGHMWEIEDSVMLLTPSQVTGPPDLPPRGDPSGDRAPTRPVYPNASGAIALPEPRDPT